MRQTFITIAIIAGVLVPVQAAGLNSKISGTWLTEQMSEITISPCETGHCGYLSKILVPKEKYAAKRAAIEAAGVDKLRDQMNKNPQLQDRPLLGLQILNLDKQRSAVLYEGEVYNPEDGNTYFGKVEVVDSGKIRLTGCGFFNLVCKSEEWVRAPSGR